MAAKQKHRTAGNSYNLRRKVEIPIELQLNNDNAFLNEFASQPEPGQSAKSRSDTDTDSSTSIDLEIGTLLSQESEDSVDESPVHIQTRKLKKSDRPSRFKNSRSREVTVANQPDQTVINDRILAQLDAIGKRLTVIEESSASAARPKAKKVTVTRGTASSSLSGSFTEGDSVKKLPELHTLRHDLSVQDQVEARIRQLSNTDVKGTDPKYKLQRGGTMDVFVKERVKWPHVLAGSTKDRITYNQLNITQWMSGFCRILRDENCQKIRDHMLNYLIALLDDSNDFSWQAAKASHAVLLCRMEQGEVTGWSDTEKIDRIRRANAQRHVVPTQVSNSSQKFRKNQSGQKASKSMPCVYYNDNSCNFQKHHETKGVFYRHICSTCFAQDGKVSVHTALDCKTKNSKND